VVRRLRDEETKLWAKVAATVKPAKGRAAPKGQKIDARAGPMILAAEDLVPARHVNTQPPPEDIEPGRKRRIVRETTPAAATLDLHGLTQDRAETAIANFLRRSYEAGDRAVLIITGRSGILWTRAPEWLSKQSLRHIVAGVSPAAQKHGGDGALYVALKKKPGV